MEAGELEETLNEKSNETKHTTVSERNESPARNPSTSTNTNHEFQGPDQCSEVGSTPPANQNDAIDSSTPARDLLDTFERMFSFGKTYVQAGQQLFADGTWMTTATFDDSPWGFLFFQRSDNWIQLALMPKDCSRRTILLDRIVLAAKDSPLRSVIDGKDHGRVILRLFFLPIDNDVHSTLAECRLDIGEGPPFHWTLNKIELPPHASPRIQMGLARSWIGGEPGLTCVSSAGNLITLHERLDGYWKAVPYPTEIPRTLENNVFHTSIPNKSKIRVRTFNQCKITQYEILGHRDWADLGSRRPEDIIAIERRDINWHGQAPSPSPASCLLIPGQIKPVAGILCKTVNNEIYLFRGHPWWNNELQPPELICAVKSGSNFVYSESSDDFLYISAEGEMKRIKFAVNESEHITFGNPCSVFSVDYLSTTLKELSLPGLIDNYIPPKHQRSHHNSIDSSSGISSQIILSSSESPCRPTRSASGSSSRNTR